MFSHLRAVLLATGTLVLVGALHTVTMANANTETGIGTGTTIALVAAPVAASGVQSAQVRAVTGASVRAIAIGY
jgi:hypothetical protein